jgi:hypothetical protein
LSAENLTRVVLGVVVAALVRLRQFQMGSGSIFLLTVPHVSIWIELLASLGARQNAIDID